MIYVWRFWDGGQSGHYILRLTQARHSQTIYLGKYGVCEWRQDCAPETY